MAKTDNLRVLFAHLTINIESIREKANQMTPSNRQMDLLEKAVNDKRIVLCARTSGPAAVLAKSNMKNKNSHFILLFKINK